MTRKNRLGKILLFVVMLSLALGMVVLAHAEADPCAGGVHKGPFTYILIEKATCTEDGSQDKYCSACGQKIGREPIIHIGHQYDTVTTMINEPTCTTKGLKQEKRICRVCGYMESVKDIDVPALGHDWGEWVQTKAPTCEEKGQETCTCRRDASHKQYRDVAATGHDWSPYVQTKAPTCEAKGQETSTCRNDASHKQYRDVPATGHKWDSGVVTKEPDCTHEGVKTFTCQNDPSHTRTEPIAVKPDAHIWDNGKVTAAPNCTNPGVKTYTCTINSAHTKTESIPVEPDAHVWDNGKVTVPAECEKPGKKVYTCKINPAHTKEEVIPATGHKWDKGTITKEPTLTDTGIKHYVCENDPSHTKDEILPKIIFSNNTMCAFGPRLREVNLYPYNTDVWYMFTPFDASQDGRQTFELVASNNYIVGTLTLTIKDGSITVDYVLKSNTIDVTLEFFTILPEIKAIHVYEPEKLLNMNMRVRTPINLQENFGDDRNLVLYFCSRVDYTYSNNFLPLDYNSATHQRILNQMLEMMDK